MTNCERVLSALHTALFIHEMVPSEYFSCFEPGPSLFRTDTSVTEQ